MIIDKHSRFGSTGEKSPNQKRKKNRYGEDGDNDSSGNYGIGCDGIVDGDGRGLDTVDWEKP